MLVVLTCTKLTTKMLEGYKCEVPRVVDKWLLTLSFEELFMSVAQTAWDESHMSCNNVLIQYFSNCEHCRSVCLMCCVFVTGSRKLR